MILFKKRLIIILLLMVIFLSGCSLIEKKPQDDEQNKDVVSEKSDKDNSEYTIDEFSDAVLSNDKELINKIIQSETVDINQTNTDDKYPIETVLEMQNCEIAEILLDAGANPHVTTSDGETVYDKVMASDNKTLINLFKKYK